MQDGHGKLVKKAGDIFEGGFKAGRVEGEVIIHFADGSKFKGSYRNGMRQGPAIEEDKEGKRFEGVYDRDERTGKFIEKDRNGQITARGHYEHGRRVLD